MQVMQWLQYVDENEITTQQINEENEKSKEG